jgi:hypothetical protein
MVSGKSYHQEDEGVNPEVYAQTNTPRAPERLALPVQLAVQLGQNQNERLERNYTELA